MEPVQQLARLKRPPTRVGLLAQPWPPQQAEHPPLQQIMPSSLTTPSLHRPTAEEEKTVGRVKFRFALSRRGHVK